MHKQIDVSVVLPDSYGARPLPVVYLLHGYGDNNLLGYLSYTNVRQYADMFDVVLVLPDGGKLDKLRTYNVALNFGYLF